MTDTTTIPAERTLHCPHCAMPRFLAGVRGTLRGVIEIKCRKCCKFATFDAATAACIQPSRAYELSIDCIACTKCEGQIARWSLEGTGVVRIPCLLRKWVKNTRVTCKHENRKVVDATLVVPANVAEGAA